MLQKGSLQNSGDNLNGSFCAGQKDNKEKCYLLTEMGSNN